MPKLPLLSEAQMRRLRRFFPVSRGQQWKDAPGGHGPPKTLYNRFIRWSRLGVFGHIFAAVAAQPGVPEQLMIDRTHPRAHRTAASLFKKGIDACVDRSSCCRRKAR